MKIFICIIILLMITSKSIIDCRSYIFSNNNSNNNYRNTNKIFGYRMLQYKNESFIAGPIKSSLSSSILMYKPEHFTETTPNLYEGITVIVEQINFNLKTILNLIDKNVNSIIVTIDTSPTKHYDYDFDDRGDGDDSSNMLILSEKDYQLIYNFNLFSIPIPIIFVKIGEYEELIKNSILMNSKETLDEIKQSEYKLVVSLGLPQIILNPPSYNFQGILKGSSLNVAPKIVILSSYDTYSIIPALSGEINNHGNTFAMFELIRILSKLYSNSNTRGSYDIIFSLVGASSLNEYGVGRWFDQQPKSIIDSIDHILCIDSIGMSSFISKQTHSTTNENEKKQKLHQVENSIDENKLYLQVSKPSTKSTKPNNQLYDLYKTSAFNQNVNLTTIQTTTIINDPNINFKHEVFSRKHIHSMTITQKFKSTILTNGILSRKPTLNQKVLKRNTKIILSSLISYIYNQSSISSNIDLLLRDSLDVNLESIESWSQVFENSNLMFPFIQSTSLLKLNNQTNKSLPNMIITSTNILQNELYNNNDITIDENDITNNNNRINILFGINSIFNEYLLNTKCDIYNTDNSIQFYQPTKLLMSFIRTKPISFDLLFISISIIYIYLFYNFIKINHQ